MSTSTGHTTTTIVKLNALRSADADWAGAKAANLGELMSAGFDVPIGFVASGEADEEAVARAAVRLGAGPLAVRSSIAAEDLPGASFAGQYESILDVRGADALAAAVTRVRASVETERVRRYQDDVAGGQLGTVGVVVQRQVPADAAGVAFTANPVTGATDEVVVSAVRGLGERLVSGEADPDEWVVRDREVTRVRVPEDSLNEDQILEVAAVARRVEAHFGFPVDIEWAFEGQQLWLLQARPITALPTTVAPIPVPFEVPEGFWERDSHFPQPLAPMSRIILTITTKALSEAFDYAGLPMDGIDSREIGGWPYQRVVPLGGKEPPRLPTWLAPRANALVAKFHPLIRRRIARLEEVERTDALMQLVDRWWNQDRAAYAARVRGFQDVALPLLSDTELEHHFDEVVRFLDETIALHHRLHMADVGFPVRLALFCSDHLGWAEQDVVEMLLGLSETSTEAGRALAALAVMAEERPAVRDLLDKPRHRSIRLDEVDAEFAEAFATYMQEFGCRALRYDVAEPTLAEVPEVALGLVRDQLVRGYDAERRAESQRQKREAAVARGRAALGSESAELRDTFEWLLERAERAYPVREDNEFWLVSSPLAVMHYAALEIGRRLVEQGRIDRPEQVFFIESAEAGRVLADGRDLRELVRRREGEVAWARSHPAPATCGTQPPAPVLAGLPPLVQTALRTILRGSELVLEATASGRNQDAADGVLTGIGASPGTYTGTVRVIHDETEFSKLRAGDVLVCPITTPVWSVLFASVGALVTDTGGILSHAAIIAREYHVPAVVATGNATSLLRDGQVVTVDGATGTTTILQPTESTR
ncbi:MAG TPA: PEP/pyruvate-binding domain-containing protein [Jiangellaceae bacterium]|nr:PEP/pyruvate-binding domain-containing protein [Jiangellaceae bacterium]